MDRNQAKEFYPILQAYAEGKVIESRTKPSTVYASRPYCSQKQRNVFQMG